MFYCLGIMVLVSCIPCGVDTVIPSDSIVDTDNTEQATGNTVWNSTNIENTTDVDVQDFIVNGTMLGQNGTADNETDLTTVAVVNTECQWFLDNPYWRLTSSKARLAKFACVCYNVCYSVDYIDYLRNISEFNSKTLSVWEKDKPFLFYLTFSLYLLMILFGTIGNIVVIFGILHVMRDKTVVNRFVVSLAVADLVMSVFITPIKLMYHIEVMKYMTLTWLCKIMLYLRQLAQTEAIVILTIISFERYYAICHPLKAKFRCSMTRCHILIGISWIVSIIIATPTVISAKYFAERSLGPICTIYYESPLLLQAHYLYFMIILLVIPTAIMIFTYGKICFVLWKSAKKASLMTNQDGKADKTPPELKARVKVIKTMVCLLVVFLVCWGPRLILNTIMVYFLYIRPIIRLYTDMLVELLANGHSLINPAIFILFSQPFRSAFAKRYPGLCCCLNVLKRTASSRSSLVSGQTVSSTDGQVNGSSTTPNNHM